MAEEIERKFLVGALPDGRGSGARVRQGYLAIDGPVEVRVRLSGEDAVLTVKGGRGRRRTEVEVPLSSPDATALWELTAGRRIEKIRYRSPLAGGLVAELDVYEGALAGLSTVEVEFADADSAAGFVAPGWFGAELTDRPGWSNADLARHGRPSER